MQQNFNRTHRVAELVQRNLSGIILREFKGPRIGLVTIVNVEVSRDLAHAKVFVSIFQEDMIEETIRVLNDASGFFRGLLAKSMSMRTIPRPRFIYDDSVVRGNRISTLIESCVNVNV